MTDFSSRVALYGVVQSLALQYKCLHCDSSLRACPKFHISSVNISSTIKSVGSRDFFRTDHRQFQRLFPTGLVKESCPPQPDLVHSWVLQSLKGVGVKDLLLLPSYCSCSSQIYIPSSSAFIPSSLFLRPWPEVFFRWLCWDLLIGEEM